MGKKSRRHARAFSSDELPAGGDSPPRGSRTQGVNSHAHPVTTSDGTLVSPGEDRKRHNARTSPGSRGSEADGVAGVEDQAGAEVQADAVETTTEALDRRLSLVGAMDAAADGPAEPRDFSWVPDVGFVDFVKGLLRALRDALHGGDLPAVERSCQGTTEALAGSGFMNRWMGDAGAYAQAALAEEDAADHAEDA